jgi:4-amino-4-deoxy-L-arabinose transferase-like glycosyltransferase
LHGNGTNPAAPPSARASFSPFLRLGIAVLFYICFFSHLGAIGFVGPDEPRYASVARSMSETGDWITPRLNGQPWFEKPVLYYWKAGAMFRVFGVSEVTARLPSALAAAFATLVLAWVARHRFGDPTSFLVLLMTPTAVGMFAFARAATPDMLFCACLTGAMCAAAQMVSGSAAGARASILIRIAFGALLGGAALAKGPAAIVLAAGSVAVWAALAKRWRDAVRLFHPLAILSFCVFALPWYILCARRNPDFLRVFIWQHNFQRYLTPEFHHPQAFWFFFAILPVAVVPWTPLLLFCARDARTAWRERNFAHSPALFLLGWVLFPLFFFSFSRSKLPGYILPAVPALILLIARSAARALDERTAFARWAVNGVCAVVIVVSLGGAIFLSLVNVEPPTPRQPFFSGLVLLFVAIAGTVTLRRTRKDLRIGLLSAALLMTVLVETAGAFILPWQDPLLSPRWAARKAAQFVGASQEVYTHQLGRGWKYGLDFYLRRELLEWTPNTPRPCWVIAPDPDFLYPREPINPTNVVSLSVGSWPGRGCLVRLEPTAHSP